MDPEDYQPHGFGDGRGFGDGDGYGDGNDKGSDSAIR